MTVSEKVIDACKKSYMTGIPVIYLVTDQLDLIENIIDAQIIPFYSDSGLMVDRKNATNLSFEIKTGFIGPHRDRNCPQLGIIKNFHAVSQDYKNAVFQFIDLHARAAANSAVKKSLLLLASPLLRIPEGLESYIEVIRVPHLEPEEIKQTIMEACAREMLTDVYINKLTEAFKGFSKKQITDTLTRIKYVSGSVRNAETAFREIAVQKKQVLEKSGTLSMVEPDSIAVGGLKELIDWLEIRKLILDNLTEAASEWKLTFSKGVLMSGLPGTGKSLMAKKTAQILGVPLIKLDMGALMGRYLGESEENMQKAQKMAVALSPCVLWIDELEKSFAGVNSSNGDNDSVMRCFSSFLTWMQDKKAPCFIFATANDISRLPAEFLRRGRFDEKFYTYMPTQKECMEIFSALMAQMNQPCGLTGRRLFEESILQDRFLYEIVEYAGSKNKFLIGADIGGILNDAVEMIFLKRKKSNANTGGSDSVLIRSIEMKEALKDRIDASKTFGETNRTDIAAYWFRVRENRFRSASDPDRMLLDFESFDEEEGKFISDRELSWDYDRRLAEFLKQEIEKYWHKLQAQNNAHEKKC